LHWAQHIMDGRTRLLPACALACLAALTPSKTFSQAPPAGYQQSGLAASVTAIARFERHKRAGLASLASGLNREELSGRLESLFSTSGSGNGSGSGSADPCTSVKLLKEDRSTKAGEAAYVVRLELHCKGAEDAVLLLPDDPQREAILYIDSRTAQNKSPMPQYGTRYFLTRGVGVTKSFHDVDGDGQPDTLGYHADGKAEPIKALPLTTRSL
jgi:hypothetical protein